MNLERHVTMGELQRMVRENFDFALMARFVGLKTGIVDVQDFADESLLQAAAFDRAVRGSVPPRV